ncbi:hypothetical protein BKA83DRAFT_4480929 [Pisolithus microcarpus]|nr:hypothetical protein BKA83DRAFT_4480929 [Pisolithus microcarpus]
MLSDLSFGLWGVFSIVLLHSLTSYQAPQVPSGRTDHPKPIWRPPGHHHLTLHHAELTKGFRLVSGNKLQDARAAFRSVLQALLLVIVSSDVDTVEVDKCHDYRHAWNRLLARVVAGLASAKPSTRWELNVDPLTLSKVEAMVRKDFGGIGPFPTYILLSTKKSMPPLSANPFTLSVPASHCPLTHITIPLLHGLRMFSRCRIPPLLIFWLDLIELLGFLHPRVHNILDDDTRMKVKQEVLVTLASLLSPARGFSAQVVAPIASVDPHMMGVKCGPFDTRSNFTRSPPLPRTHCHPSPACPACTLPPSYFTAPDIPASLVELHRFMSLLTGVLSSQVECNHKIQ